MRAKDHTWSIEKAEMTKEVLVASGALTGKELFPSESVVVVFKNNQVLGRSCFK